MYSNLGAAGVFCSINLLVVCGNLFVLYVLVSQKSLHTSTNFIVLSLTVADFLLGIIVVPFAILQEFSHNWLFGDVWCKMWLALDVLLSTASIYNLLAISFDRYMAVRQPIKYRFISSSRMTKITISVVWIISSLLAFPPLVYEHIDAASANKSENGYQSTCTPATSNDVYILFSAFVSFILPAVLMVFLNIRIFQTVAESRRLPILPGKAVSSDDVSTLLRVHIGNRGDAKNTVAVIRPSLQYQIAKHINAIPQSTTSRKVSLFQRSNSNVIEKCVRPKKNSLNSIRKQTLDTVISLDRFEADSFESETTVPADDPRPKLKNGHIDYRQKSMIESESMSTQSDIKSMLVQSPLKRTNSTIEKAVDSSIWYPAIVATLLAGKKPKKSSERLLLFPLLQTSRNTLRTELRVARTIIVVVGCFTICWLPFTIIYVLQAFKTCPVGECVPYWLFTFVFWLGYTNSAVNPILYAAFSRDFRSAFKKVLVDRTASFH